MRWGLLPPTKNLRVCAWKKLYIQVSFKSSLLVICLLAYLCSDDEEKPFFVSVFHTLYVFYWNCKNVEFLYYVLLVINFPTTSELSAFYMKFSSKDMYDSCFNMRACHCVLIGKKIKREKVIYGHVIRPFVSKK